MKKTLSLILAALMCAATTSAVAAEEAVVTAEVAEEAAVVEVVAIAEEVAAEEAVVAETQVAPYDANVLVALAAQYGIVITPEFVDAVLTSGIELNVENILAIATACAVELTEEQATLIVAVLASVMVAPIAEEAPVEAETAVVVEEVIDEEVVAEEAVIEEVAVEEAVIEEVAVEEVAIEEIVVEEVVEEVAIVEEVVEEITLANNTFLAPARVKAPVQGIDADFLLDVAYGDVFAPAE